MLLSFFSAERGMAARDSDEALLNVMCQDCSPKARNALKRLLAAKGDVVATKGEYMVLDSGIAVNRECLNAFSETLPATVTTALQRGLRCLAATPAETTRMLVSEMASVLGQEHAALPVVLCRTLVSRQMKGMGVRSEERRKSPYIVLSPVMSHEDSEYIQAVVFHEFIHLGGNGHPHGAQRELATPCQECCFEAGLRGAGARDFACRVCTTDYTDKFDPVYIRDLTSWARLTPGSEFIARINRLDGVRRAGGDVRFFVELVREFRDHPFGFELASEVLKSLSLEGDDAATVRAVARKKHGHVTKRFAAFGRSIAKAAILRFELARKGEDPQRVLEAVSDLLERSTLPQKGTVPRLDMPIFYKYYYEFALLRGVLADEVYGLWRARFDAVCGESASCPELYRKRRIFSCQKAGLDYDVAGDVCQ
ncbi:hypothetical protein N1030_17510 [Desulfovibrio mangrovi]|uniref:hypothetical protein n=1 Tax=Desulfovibrio mangrovi TaxID=2976983 RepID=UPI00224559BE|nr:hypothetical protein [Desulfovibrio mangrovi]UZP67371.1 hypothetical protein N1030_17510 [Desulfovibrio mangrovi]